MTTWINHVLVPSVTLRMHYKHIKGLMCRFKHWVTIMACSIRSEFFSPWLAQCFPKLWVICILIFMFEVNISWKQVFFKHFWKAFPIITSRSLSFCLDCKCRQSLHFQRQVHLEFVTYLANSNYADYIKPQGNAPPSTEDFFLLSHQLSVQPCNTFFLIYFCSPSEFLHSAASFYPFRPDNSNI